MFAAAAVALAGCAKSEVLDVAQYERPISFDPFVENQTKATNDITDGTEAFKEFYVFGAKGTKEDNAFTADQNGGETYLNHVQVSGGKGSWTYYPHVSWVANKTFRFAAYANGTGDGTVRDSDASVISSSNEAKLANVTFVTNDANNKWGLDISGYTVRDRDLIVAVPEEKLVGEISTAPASVGMTFKHALAKVIIQFRYNRTVGSNLQAQIEPFSFNAFKTGNCVVRYTGDNTNNTIGATWTTTGTASAYEFFPAASTNDFVTWADGNKQQEMYVIPQSNSGITIDKITLNTINSNGETTSTVEYKDVSLTISGHTDWKPGYVYRYIADVNTQEHYIHFTTSVTSWIDEDNRNQNITASTTSSDTNLQ